MILNWQTTADAGARGFEIERRGNGTDFVKIGSVNGKDVSADNPPNSFQYIDGEIQPGIYAYRLKRVLPNKSLELLSVVKINANFAVPGEN